MTILSKILFGHCAVEESQSADRLNICNDNISDINPASGLPMLNDSKIDVAGSPVGINLSDEISQVIDDITLDSIAGNFTELSCQNSFDNSHNFNDLNESHTDVFTEDWDSNFDIISDY